MKKLKNLLTAPLIGIVNSLFASGGGLIAVPLIRGYVHDQKKAQANALAVTLPLSAVTMFVYWCNGYFSVAQSIRYIPFGFIGALVGTKLLKKLPDNLLRKIFSVFMLWAGFRTVF